MRLAVLLALLLAGTTAGGSASPGATPAAAPGEPCTGQEVPVADAPAQLPLGLPASAGSTVLRVAEQGRTTVAFASLPGTRDEIVPVRDRVLQDLATAGYRVVGTDQELGYEAEAELAGPYEGTLKVAPLCGELLEVRYKIDR